jgi:hypothetical protein
VARRKAATTKGPDLPTLVERKEAGPSSRPKASAKPKATPKKTSKPQRKSKKSSSSVVEVNPHDYPVWVKVYLDGKVIGVVEKRYYAGIASYLYTSGGNLDPKKATPGGREYLAHLKSKAPRKAYVKEPPR